MSSPRVIDLRGKRTGKPPAGQRSLFSRPPKEPKKPMPLRAKRRRVRAAIALFFLLLIAGVVWGVSYASYLPQFSIETVRVTGAESVPPELIERYAWSLLKDGSYHYLSRENIFVYPRAVLEKAIAEDFPRIRSVHVSRADYLSTALDITVEERRAYALWCPLDAAQTANTCFRMDDDGFIFSDNADASASRIETQYVFRGGLSYAASSTASSTPQTISNPVGQTFAPAHVPGLAVLLRLLGQAGFTPQGATIESAQDFSVPLAEGFVLKASFGSNADTLVKNLELVLDSDELQGKESELEYVDLRFGNRVYYKLKGKEEVSTQ